MAAETAQAPTKRTAMAVTWGGEYKPKLTKRRPSQKTRMRRRGSGS